MDEKNPVATDVEAVWRFIQLRGHPERAVRFEAFMISIVTSKDSKHGKPRLMKRIEREWSAVIAGVHLQRSSTIGKLLDDIAYRWKPVVSIGNKADEHQPGLQSGSSRSFLTRSGYSSRSVTIPNRPRSTSTSAARGREL